MEASESSSDAFRANMAELAEQARRDSAARPPGRQRPHLVPLVVVVCLVLAAMIAVWRIGMRSHEDRPVAVSPEPAKPAPTPPAKIATELKPVEQPKPPRAAAS